MKKFLKVSLGVLMTTCCVTAMAGCGKSGKDVRYLNFKPEIADVYEEVAKEYKKETGNNLIVETAASGTYETKLKSRIDANDAPTIFQINGPVGYSTWKDYCANLKDSKLYTHLSDKSLAVTSGDGVYGIPYTVEGYGIIYNAKLVNQFLASTANKTGITKNDDINNYAKLLKVVEGMQADKANLGIDGVFAATSLKPGEDWRWQTHTFNMPLYNEFKTAQTTPKEIEFKFNENYKNIMDLYLNNSTTEKTKLGTVDVNTSMAEFALGKCAMVQNGNWGASQILGVKGVKVDSADIKFLPLYTGVSGEEKQGLCIGTENFLAINSKSSAEDQATALEFLDWLFTSKTGKSFVVGKLGFIAPFDSFSADEKPADPLSQQVMEWMNKQGVTSVPWKFTIMPSQKFKDNLGANLLAYAQGTMTWADLVTATIADWKKEAASVK